MRNIKDRQVRGNYTLEFKLEACGWSKAARMFGMPVQMLGKWGPERAPSRAPAFRCFAKGKSTSHG
jgi:hypothetical protein